MPPPGFEPTIPASKRPQTHALDRAATGVGHVNVNDLIFLCNSLYSPSYWQLQQIGSEWTVRCNDLVLCKSECFGHSELRDTSDCFPSGSNHDYWQFSRETAD